MPAKSPEALARRRARALTYGKEWVKRDRKKNPEKYAAYQARRPSWKIRHYNEKARLCAFIRASSVCFGDDRALRQALVFESAYAEYEEWFASLDEAESGS